MEGRTRARLKSRCVGELNRETGSTSTARCGVRVIDLECGADQFGGKVDFRTRHKFQAHFIDKDANAVARHNEVVAIGCVIQIELIGESRAAAAFDGNP